MWAAAQAFGAPFTLVADNRGEGTLAAAAAGKIYIGTDTPGAGAGAPGAIRRMRNCVLRLLEHAAILEGGETPSPPTRFVRVAPEWGELRAPYAGLFEPVAEVGEVLASGQIVARLHPDNLSAAPAEVLCPAPAILIGRRPAGWVESGQRIGVLAEELPSQPP